jgi:isocitrate lyase
VCDSASRLGELGYAWQFITVAGFHINALGTDMFARDYKDQGMFAYMAGHQAHGIGLRV